jgi:hypothetical protein
MLLLTAADINRLARHFGISDGEVRRLYLENKYTFRVNEDGSCIFLARDRMSRRCTVHEARPDQCRRFPYGKPCPYLEREDLLAQIQPRVEKPCWEDRQHRRRARDWGSGRVCPLKEHGTERKTVPVPSIFGSIDPKVWALSSFY